MPERTKSWYETLCLAGHVGSGNYEEKIVFFYASDINELLNIKYRVPSLKKSKSLRSLRLLNKDEAAKLELMIIKEGRIPLQNARRQGWYFGESLSDISDISEI
ncbi:hypothetical protein B6U80_00830 [Candidatus Pacearchaeota archaeon ex4484_26]|nr:MAG: hypothetical protein B6U80_00830 [Candidatus Pacearchaeota archaeon ex4484_26]